MRQQRRVTVWSMLLLALMLGGCSGVSTPTRADGISGAATPVVTVLRNPDSAAVQCGQQVALAVQARGLDLRVRWSAERGRLSSAEGLSTIYTAPDEPGMDEVELQVHITGGSTTRTLTFSVVVPTSASPTSAPTPVPSLATETASAPQAPTVTPPPTAAPRATATETPNGSASPTSQLPTLEDTGEFRLPLITPLDVAFDGSNLHALFASGLVRLEPVAGEGRFRAGDNLALFAGSRGLSWDESRTGFWVVSGESLSTDDFLWFADPLGERKTTYATPDSFLGDPIAVAWDGAHLWVASGEGPLYKLEVNGEALSVVDSFAPPSGFFTTSRVKGLAWDGQHIWVVMQDALVKVDQTGRTLCTVYAVGQGLWWGFRGVAWDGHSLWVGHQDENCLYRIDPSQCK